MSGDFFSSVGDALSGGADALGQMFGPQGLGGSIGDLLGGAGAGGASPTATADATTQAIDPTGSIGATAAIDAGQNAPQPNQTQQGQGGQGQGAGSPVDQLTKALKAVQAQRKQQPQGQSNPYVTGGGTGANVQAVQGRPAPISRPDAINAGLYSPNIAPADAVNAGLLDPSLIDPATGDINRNPTPPPPPPPDPRAGSTGEAAVRDALATPEATFTAPPQGPTLPGGAPSLGGLAQSALPDALAAPGLAAGLYFGPGMGTADSGELKPGQPGYGQSYPKGTDPGSYPGSTDYPQAQPGKPQLPSDKGQTPTKEQYRKWLEKMGVDPKEAKKQADAAPLPTKKPKEGQGGPTPSGHGPIMRDISGGQGVPMMLGQLAQIAIPLMMMLGAGGFGGGRHGRFGGFRHGGFGGRHGGFGGFPGGFRGHPGFGGRPGFGERPGFGGFRPNRGFGGRDVIPGRRSSWLGYNQQDQGITGNPQLDQLLQSLGVGGQNQNQVGFGAQQSGGGGGQGGGGGEGPAPANGPWSINPFLSNVVGSESGGRNISVVDSDGQMARGIYQFHDGTWREMAKKVPGASQYARADLAPPEVQQAVALVTPFNQWGPNTKAAAHRKFGNFDENLTMGQLADQFGGAEWASRDKTKTGGSQEPNPDGNSTKSPPNIKDPSEWPNNIAAQ